MPFLNSLEFGEPAFLWLLAAAGALFVLWGLRLMGRVREIKRYRKQHIRPVRERFKILGQLGFWLFLLIAMSLCVVALARPRRVLSVIQKQAVDIVVVQDGSASMRARDVAPDRWGRSMAWIDTLAKMLSWKGDRVGLALFANHAAPQIRLTRDPNILLFFLAHLKAGSPFRVEDDPTWDTNIESGIYWAIKLMDKDRELRGVQSKNPQGIVVISDGQAWSGEVQKSLALARVKNVPVYVIGVGTVTGAKIPVPDTQLSSWQSPYPDVVSVLDRESLQRIAAAGQGRYFELNTVSDQAIVIMMLNDLRRRAPMREREEVFSELYWYFLLAAAVSLGFGILSLRS